jgi:hypothetical protein
MCAPSRCKRTRHLTLSDSRRLSRVKRKSRPALCVSTAKRCCCHQYGGRGRVEGHLQEGGGVAVAQRMVMSLSAQQRAASLVAILTVESAPACPPPAGTCQPTCPENGGFRGGAGSWEDDLGRGGEGSRTLMWTRRVECAGPSARPARASSCAGRWKFLFLERDKLRLEGPASDLPWGPGRPPHRSAAHQRTSTHEQIVDKARLLMGKTACNTHASPPGFYWRTVLLCGRWGSCAFLLM